MELIQTKRSPFASGTTWDRARLSNVYAATISGLGVAGIWSALQHLPEDRVGLFLFILLAIVTELFSVELFSNSRSRVSISSILAIAAMLTFGPYAGAITQMAAGVTTSLVTTLQHPDPAKRDGLFKRATFNAGMFVLAALMSGQTFILMGGRTGDALSLRNLIPLSLAVSVDLMVNILLLLGVISLKTGQRPADIWKRDFEWGVPLNLFSYAVGGWLISLAFVKFGWSGCLAFFLPVLCIGYSFRLYVSRSKEYVNRLETMNATLDKANLGLLEALGAVIDAYDVFTYGHSHQVTQYAADIAAKMGLPEEDQATIVKAALVHDVGKVGVADAIIGKQGKLTDDEFGLVRRHPEIGANIVGRVEGLQELVPLIRHHHERWNGKGYPDGLAGEDIPLGARIICLADAVDAMSSSRPYNSPKTIDEIKADLLQCAGVQFDPAVVQAFLAVLDEMGEDYIHNSAADVARAVQAQGMGGVVQGVRYLKGSAVFPPKR